MQPFPIMTAIGDLNAMGDDSLARRRKTDAELQAENYRRDQQFRADMSRRNPQPGIPNYGSDYNQAFSFATGGPDGNPAFTPSNAYYGTPEASQTRNRMRESVATRGFQVPGYMWDQPTVSPERRAASPLADALVGGGRQSGGGDPVRDQMMWQFQNPTASRVGNTVMYAGNLDDPRSVAGRAADNQQVIAGNLLQYDTGRKQQDVMGGQIGRMAAEAELNRQQAAAVPGQLAADQQRAQGAADQGAAALLGANTEKRVVDERLPKQFGPMQPGQVPTPIESEARLMQHPAGASVLGLVQKGVGPDGAISGRLSDMLAGLDRNGAFNDPNIASTLPGTIYKYWQPEIDRIMGGGLENKWDYLSAQGALSGFGYFGSPIAGGPELDVLRRRVAGMYPGMFRETTPAGRGMFNAPVDTSRAFQYGR